MTARDEILARVRAALADVPVSASPTAPTNATVLTLAADPSPAAPAAVSSLAATPRAAQEPTAQLADRFAERAAEYRATVRRCAPNDLAATLAAVLADHGARRVATPPGLPAAWTPQDVELIADDALPPRGLDQLDGVLTGCALAIADTGTLVLDAGPRCGRRALTLVPDLHVCVVEAAQVVADLPAAFAQLTPQRPLTFVSGPSATSDIELDRVEGVHGPRRLELVLTTHDLLTDSR